MFPKAWFREIAPTYGYSRLAISSESSDGSAGKLEESEDGVTSAGRSGDG